MARFSWADRINGHVGSLVDQVLIYAGVGTALALFVFDFPMWLVAVAGLVIAFGVPLALHFFAPGLYMTSGEKYDAFERTRRFGRKRDDG